MRKSVKKTITATILNVIVALFIVAIITFIVVLFLGAKIGETMSIVSKISINVEEKEIKGMKLEIEQERPVIKNYPEYGTKYATIEIPSINVNLPVYFGETLNVLKKGVGHSSGSYFPGEGGSIIYMGHNFANMFRNFSKLEKGNEITITTEYGKYVYKIYDMKVVKETDLDALPIQNDKEILMVYTCYPFNNIGYATQRYVVYAELVDQIN